MATELEKLHKALQEAQRDKAEAQRREQEERRLREEAQRDKIEERRLREQEHQSYERRTGKSTLPEFLDACHTHLHLGLTIQPDSTQSTKGDPANAENKPRPDRILPWLDFHKQQADIWDILTASDFVRKRQFTSLHTLVESGETVRRQMMGSELDLHSFARRTVEEQVTQIIERIYENETLRTYFGLEGSVKFENHSNTLSPDRAAEAIQSLSISSGPRRSKRLRNATNNTSLAVPSQSATNQSRPRADQFCVYNISGRNGEMDQRIAALIKEYKAPHKLTLAHINQGLGEMDLDEVVEQGDDESVAVRCRRLVAAVITQGFSYMVKAGLEYGEIYTGEATIFLRIPDDPSTVYYALSVPKGDVGPSTGWKEHGTQPNRLHLTAVGQAVAFTLRALQTSPRGAQWTRNALGQLKTWAIIVKDAEEAIAKDEAPSSEYRPSPNVVAAVIRSPIQIRSRKRMNNPEACIPSPPSSAHSDEDPDGDPRDPDTPSRQAPVSSSRNTRGQSTKSGPGSKQYPGERGGGNAGRRRSSGDFCTPSCLLGLMEGGPLDYRCPNVKKHGKGSHALNKSTLMRCIRQMLDTQLDYCQELSICGARGALFKIRLPRHGYTFVAKGTGVECVGDLLHESAVYERLHPIQGEHVPVHLGHTAVSGPLYYAGAVQIVHMLFLSFAGFSLRSPIPHDIPEKAILGLQAIHELGVLQKDPAARNILVHPDSSRLNWIDFERAEFLPLRQALGNLSPNRKRKLEQLPKEPEKKTKKPDLGKSASAYQVEIESARWELNRLVQLSP